MEQVSIVRAKNRLKERTHNVIIVRTAGIRSHEGLGGLVEVPLFVVLVALFDVCLDQFALLITVVHVYIIQFRLRHDMIMLDNVAPDTLRSIH